MSGDCGRSNTIPITPAIAGLKKSQIKKKIVFTIVCIEGL